jgi:hypothetical protein
MAMLRWNFNSYGTPIVGEMRIKNLSNANKLRDALNAVHGEGSHWVEPLNFTEDEMLKQIKEDLNATRNKRYGQ